MFPWMSAATGRDTSLAPPFNLLEQHIVGDVAMLARQYWHATRDDAWLRATGLPLAEGIATFWMSRVVPSAAAPGNFSIK